MKIFAHRGAWFGSFENTVEACQAALEMPVDAIEIDLLVSQDQKVVLLHENYTGERSQASSALVKHQTAKQLKQVRLGKGYRIPLFEEILSLVNGRKELILELKDYGMGSVVVNELRKCHYPLESVSFTSYIHTELDAVAEVLPGAKTIPVVDCVLRSYDSLFVRNHPYAVSMPRDFLRPKEIDRVKAEGCEVYVFTVDDPREADQMAAWGVHGVYSNQPDLLIRK